MPPRDNLFTKHPLAIEEKLPDGCLWERYRKHDDEDDEDDDEVKDDPPTEQEEEEDFFRPIGPPYVSHKQVYPNLLEPLLDHLDTLREEALSIPQWTAWPERQHYRSFSATNGDNNVASWTVFPLCHCFPAQMVENRKWIPVTCEHVPKTIELLRDILGDFLRTALFSRLDPETTLEAHTGWQDLANHVFRVHIPLVVPLGGLCGTWVDGCVETHEEGRPLCFDDAKVHRAFNYSKQERVVLILDLARPSYLPVGTATGGHTEELDDFIAQLT
jgi:aspartyl/asparaginyl beta-hydroxylase (cupin superfamily)